MKTIHLFVIMVCLHGMTYAQNVEIPQTDSISSKNSIESIDNINEKLSLLIETNSSITNELEKIKRDKNLQVYGTLLLSVLAIIFSAIANRRISRQKMTELKEKVNSYERLEIYKRLNEFYAPLLMLRKSSKILHDTFKGKSKFSTLQMLLKGEKYEGNDKELLLEILKIGKDCKRIILSKSGLIVDEKIRNIQLPKLVTHLTLIEKAYYRELEGEAERFTNFSFPSTVDDYLETSVKDMLNRLQELNDLEK